MSGPDEPSDGMAENATRVPSGEYVGAPTTMTPLAILMAPSGAGGMSAEARAGDADAEGDNGVRQRPLSEANAVTIAGDGVEVGSPEGDPLAETSDGEADAVLSGDSSSEAGGVGVSGGVDTADGLAEAVEAA